MREEELNSLVKEAVQGKYPQAVTAEEIARFEERELAKVVSMLHWQANRSSEERNKMALNRTIGFVMALSLLVGALVSFVIVTLAFHPLRSPLVRIADSLDRNTSALNEAASAKSLLDLVQSKNKP